MGGRECGRGEARNRNEETGKRRNDAFLFVSSLLRFLISPALPPSHTSVLIVLLLIATASAPFAQAQPVRFGAADDPREELQRVWWRYESSLDVGAGPSLIGPQWRAGAVLDLDLVTRPVVGRFIGTVRGGAYGTYGEDFDEWYDLVRLVRFVRYNAPPASPLHLRAGLIRQMRLGTGHLVNFYRSDVAWEARTVGLETALTTRAARLAAFTDDVRLDGVTGAHLQLRPLFFADGVRTRSLSLGLSAATDLGLLERAASTDTTEAPTAYAAEAAFDVLDLGGIRLAPFASYAAFQHYGRGFSAGVDLESANFIDLARFRVRLAYHRRGDEFLPGYFGALYRVNGARARTVAAKRFFADAPAPAFVGVPLSEVRAGNGLETELRFVFFERFELWSHFVRQYGAQDLSAYHLRLFAQTESLRFDVGLDRTGRRGVISLLDPLGDESALLFGADYGLTPRLWLRVRARYTFEEIGGAPDGTPRFLAERRFEPMLTLRVVL